MFIFGIYSGTSVTRDHAHKNKILVLLHGRFFQNSDKHPGHCYMGVPGNCAVYSLVYLFYLFFFCIRKEEERLMTIVTSRGLKGTITEDSCQF